MIQRERPTAGTLDLLKR